MTQKNGTLPKKCPTCKKMAKWVWDEEVIYDDEDFSFRNAKCSKCNERYTEYYEDIVTEVERHTKWEIY